MLLTTAGKDRHYLPVDTLRAPTSPFCDNIHMDASRGERVEPAASALWMLGILNGGVPDLRVPCPASGGPPRRQAGSQVAKRDLGLLPEVGTLRVHPDTEVIAGLSAQLSSRRASVGA